MENRMPDKKEGAVFNMAIATLEKVHNLLLGYSSVSIAMRNQPNDLIVAKYDYANQIMIQTIPLLKKEDRQKSRDEFNKIKIEQMWKKHAYRPESKLIHVHTPEIENQLDNYIIFLQELLQETHNYFMPSGKDARYGWSQQ